MLQTLIFIMQADQRQVSIPDIANTEGGSVNQLLHWSKSVENPHPDETGVQVTVALEGDEPDMNDKRDRQDDPDRPFGFDNDSAHPLYRFLCLVHIFANTDTDTVTQRHEGTRKAGIKDSF